MSSRSERLRAKRAARRQAKRVVVGEIVPQEENQTKPSIVIDGIEVDIKGIAEMLSFDGVCDEAKILEALNKGYDNLLEIAEYGPGAVGKFTTLLNCFLRAAKLHQDERKLRLPKFTFDGNLDTTGVSLSSITARIGA